MNNNVLIKFSRTPEFKPKIFFDVGANVGQTALEMAKLFPETAIHSFEPVGASFQALSEATQDIALVSCHNLALGDAAGEVVMSAAGTSTANSIRNLRPSARTETVGVTTGDIFCQQNGIDHIDLLKIDVEGYEPQTIAGFSRMLRERRVGYVQLECGVAPENTYHIPLFVLVELMSKFNYGLFGLFDERRTMTGLGRRNGILFCNAVFVLEND